MLEKEMPDGTTEIEGSIGYKIIISKDNTWRIEYDSTIENDIAAMGIAQSVSEELVVGMDSQKSQLKGKELISLKNLIRKAIDGRFGIKLMCDYMQLNYRTYKKMKAAEDAKEQEKEAKVVDIKKIADA